ncbi:ketopantoate reductase family protein [Rhodalgimonas zhirmunskyi]|uniref:2-dehydropantoate 2-reductase n=1 Tax=Rhodalgimonas zhirmunskyi TaxID=2964767 RepID=A0AAJ1X3B0_9RHOB|nr:2-dehydropantoate 2-reductase N-terminal domain-containing protein [Rhodoalgimonas zhirmunskyi]MDQ2093128.1 NAD(P)-binding domain-containing protein [Rhodoalgimonas zhirmunskyi]
MNSFHKIGVIGAGNIGTAMAALLSQSGAQVWLTARGARLEQIARDGIELDDRGKVIKARPNTCEQLSTPVDALFVCVKSQSLASAIYQNRAAITPDTLVIPMVNGLPFWFYADASDLGSVPLLDPDNELARLLTPQQVLGAVLLMTVQMDEAGRAKSSNTPTLSLGAVCDGVDTDRVDQLISLLAIGGVRSAFDPDIRQKVLVKLLANFATNPLSALTGSMLSEMGQTPALRDIACALADEFRNWAQSEGYALPSNTWLVDLMIDAGAFPTSMLQDAVAGKPLELDAICLAPMELAKRKGASMPTLRWLLDRLTTVQTLPVEESQLPDLIQTLHLSQTA